MQGLRKLYASTVFYPTLAWNYSLAKIFRVRNWWDRIGDTNVIVGAYPFASEVPAMHQAGVRAVVNTCEEYAGPMDAYDQYNIVQLRIPTTDFTHPLLKDVVQAVEFVQEHASAGDGVYIHCKAGRARSATVALCWLMKYQGMTAAEGQAKLLESRAHVNPRLTQRPVVKEFANQLPG